MLLKQGHAAAAATELSLLAEFPVWSDVRARRHLAHDWDDLDIATTRWELLAGSPAKAEAALAQLLARARSRGDVRRSFKLRLLHAMAQARRGDEHGAVLSVLPLLHEVGKEGAVRLFVDEGPLAAALIVRAQAVAEGSDPLFADYMQRLLTAFGSLANPLEAVAQPRRDTPGPLEPLTSKEIKLLQMLGEGYSNRALAEKLFVSESTVRTHLRKINAKLLANNRTQAVSLGRRYGLIA